jgi:UDP-N-acetylglucosamine 4,6-dehydratase (inverting)
MLNNKVLLITGGTGSFGKKFVEIVLKKFPKIKKLIIFSRDELKQYDMQLMYPEKIFPQLRFFLGDVRDKNRLSIALEKVDYVVHAAALKQVPAAEYNPFEFIQTNVIGANNLIESCILKKVKKVIALSTDKAAAPINLYGATKLCSDKLFISANNIVGGKKISFTVVRYGNVMMSRGSVVPLFLKNKSSGVLNITDKNMTRFSITLEEGVNFVLFALAKSIGQEILVPKLSSYNILDLAKAISEKSKIKIIGIRNGEKIHEEMITKSDSYNTIESKNFYVVLPSMIKNYHKYLKLYKAKKINKPFSYNSSDNLSKLTIKDLKYLVYKK